MLGDSQRPLLSEADVDKFLDVINNKQVWTFNDFSLATNIRYFNEKICSCAECQQHGNCAHVLSRRIVDGEEIPHVLPNDVESPQF